MVEPTNIGRKLAFDDKHLKAEIIENAKDFLIDGIVVNLSAETIHIDDATQSPIRAWRSATLFGKKIISAKRIAVLKIIETENLGGVNLRGWEWFGDTYAGFPRETPLYLSKVDKVGTVETSPEAFITADGSQGDSQKFDIYLKCWWAPSKTDCFIHTEHPFLEVHTQIFGDGLMQKFTENNAKTNYENVRMAPGFTHEAFCQIGEHGHWFYPWHRYFCVTESIWLAIELHPHREAAND